jgi:hypothetical protein
MHGSSYCRIPLQYEFPAFARSDDNNFPLYPSWVLSSQFLRDGDRSLALNPRTSFLFQESIALKKAPEMGICPKRVLSRIAAEYLNSRPQKETRLPGHPRFPILRGAAQT